MAETPHELPLRSITVGGRKTSIRLDDYTWDTIGEICRSERITKQAFWTQVDQERGNSPMATATRVAVIKRFRRNPLATAHARGGDLMDDIVRKHGHLAIGDQITEEYGGGYERKILFAIDNLGSIEAGALLDRLAIWSRLSSDRGGVPCLDLFAAQLCDEGAWYNQIDTSVENPFNFRAMRVNPASSQLTGFDMSGRTVGDYPFLIHSRGMQADFNLVKSIRLPLYQILYQRNGRMGRAYTRLILPFSIDGDAVDRLVTVVRPLMKTAEVEEDSTADRGLDEP